MACLEIQNKFFFFFNLDPEACPENNNFIFFSLIKSYKLFFFFLNKTKFPPKSN